MKLCEQVLLYQKGELDSAFRHTFEKHLATCAACQSELKFLEKLDAALIPPAAPADLVDKVFAKTTRKKTWVGVWKKVLAGVAASVVAVVLFVDLHHPSNTAFNTQEIVAYMNGDLAEEYQLFEADLSAMEEDFNIGG